MIGTVKGSIFQRQPESTDLSILLQVEIADSDDLQTVEFFARNGDQSIPVIDSRVAILNVGENYKIAIAADDGLPPDPLIRAGEKKFYSVSVTPGASEAAPDIVTVQAVIKLLETGEIRIQSTNGLNPNKIVGDILMLPNGNIEISSNDAAGADIATLKLTPTGKIELDSQGGTVELTTTGTSIEIKTATGSIKVEGNELELNGNSDFAVSHTDLNLALQGLVTAINTTFATKLDGGGTLGTLTLDLTSAKVDTVKLP